MTGSEGGLGGRNGDNFVHKQANGNWRRNHCVAKMVKTK